MKLNWVVFWSHLGLTRITIQVNGSSGSVMVTWLQRWWKPLFLGQSLLLSTIDVTICCFTIHNNVCCLNGCVQNTSIIMFYSVDYSTGVHTGVTWTMTTYVLYTLRDV